MTRGIIYPGSAFVGVESLPIFVFWVIIFAPHILAKQSRAVNTFDIRWFS